MSNNMIEETKQNNDKNDKSNYNSNVSQKDLITRNVFNDENVNKNNIQTNLEIISVYNF